MRIFLALLDDGSLRLRGAAPPPDLGTITLVSPKGAELFGLPYEEAIQYAWIDTSPDGLFVSGEKLPPRDLSRPFDIPHFLRQKP